MNNLYPTLLIMEKKGTNSNAFIRGCIVGYLIRHFFPPKEMTTGGWIITGIFRVFILILLCINIKVHYDNVKNKKK